MNRTPCLVHAETWLGHELGVSKLTPGIRYIHNRSPKTMPCLGNRVGSYRRAGATPATGHS